MMRVYPSLILIEHFQNWTHTIFPSKHYFWIQGTKFGGEGKSPTVFLRFLLALLHGASLGLNRALVGIVVYEGILSFINVS
jgi:hypothetical protein